MAGVITALIILATLLLLGFSVYLAAYLGFISLPLPFTQGQPSVPQTATVPNLVGDSWAQAQQAASAAGFVVNSDDGSHDGVVQSQSPLAGQSMAKGLTIDVKMGASVQPVTIPPNLAGKPLDTVEQLLTNANLTYTIQNARPRSHAVAQHCAACESTQRLKCATRLICDNLRGELYAGHARRHTDARYDSHANSDSHAESDSESDSESYTNRYTNSQPHALRRFFRTLWQLKECVG